MSRSAKFLLGLAATLLMGWIVHDPLGGGERLAGRLEAQAKGAVERAAVPGVEVRLQRDPLSRQAVLSGPADRFQREGRGSLKGLNDHVSEIEGIAGVEWSNPPPAGGPS